jgi:hypothetical protein
MPCASYAPTPRREGQAIKVYCHLCGATLRSGDQYQQLDTLPHQDTIYVCRDERRCELRAAQDPLTGRPYSDPGANLTTRRTPPSRSDDTEPAHTLD